MKKRLFAAFVSLCMIVSMLPTMAFAEAGAQDSGIVTSASGLCEHHTQHDSACGYTEGTAEIPYSHEHDEACGYVPGTEGTPCTFVCEVCNAQDSGNAEDSSDAQPEECTCETLCTEEEVNGDCPVCSAEGAELDKVCIGAAPMLAAAAPLSSEHSGHDGWKTLSGTIEEFELPAGNYVLTGDVTLGNGLYRCESVTICLNGHKIDGNTKWLGKVTICDCTGNGNMYNFTEMYNISLSNVKLRDCEITGSATIDGNTTIYAGCRISAGADESITINSNTTITPGVEIGVGESGILSLNGANVQSAIDVTGGTCNITGGTISSPILVRVFGTCNITGGTISSPIVVGGTCNITGGTIKVYDYPSSGEITGAVVVKGGSCSIGGDAQITGRIGNGGAVSVLGGNCTISGSNIYDNNTKYGGVYVENGTCTIEKDAYITGNQAFDQGGGVYVAGGVCDIYGTIGSNYTADNNDGDGGGVYVAGGECNIYGTIFKNTAKRDGGGVYVAGGKCDIAATSINYNEAAGNGGGIYVAGGECRIATQTIGLNTATGNGGGVYVASGAKVTVNNTEKGPPRITHNTANGNGGGVYLCEGVEWNNLCYVTTNTAQYGGGIYSEGDCKLTIRNGSVEGNTATVEGGGLYLNDSQTKPCIVEITNWTIKENKDNSSQPNNMVSLNSQITYEQGLSTQDTLPYEETGSIVLRNDASFTIMSGKYEASEISSCFTRQSDNKLLIAGGYYDADPSKEPTLTVVDGVKAIELDGDIGYNRYDPNYPWAVYPVKDGIMSGTSNNPVYDGASIEKDGDFSLSGTDIEKLYYWYKAQGAEDSAYVAGLPSDAGDYTIKVGGLHLRTIGEEYYTECTFDLTIAKADPSYTVPTGITAQVGKPLSDVTLPEGWAWKDESTIPQTEGTQTYPAIFTPDDTANYNTVETGISVGVVNEPVVREYAITFDANGGSVNPSGSSTKNGKLESLPTPTHGGYDLLGWYTQKDGGEKVTTDTVFTKNSIIYAHWQEQTAQEYTVTFNANGGSVSTTSTTTKDGKLESLPTPTYDGYDFLGWYTEKDGGEKVTTDTVFTKDTTIYAHWQKQAAQAYTVTFDANGGSVTPSSVTTKDGKLESLPTPTRGGYDFLGWYTEKDGGEKVITDTVFTKDTTIYAHWQKQAAQEYTVTFDANGGTINSGVITSYTYGVGATLPTDVTREGYTFAGWYASADFSGDPVAAIGKDAMGDKTYWAKWEEVENPEPEPTPEPDPDPTPTPTPTPDPEPSGPSTGDSTGWDDIRDELENTENGDEITIDMGDETKVPAEIFESLAGKDVEISFDLGDIQWSVNGADIPEDADFTDIDMGVTMNSDGIPVDVVNAITGERSTVQITLAHDGEFGFTMTLTAPLGVENAGYWANLYHYDEDADQLTFETAAEIDADGSVTIPFSHASQYAIVIDTHSHATVDVSDLFIDIAPNAWYKDAVQYAYDNGLMTGVSATEFAPEATTTRAMIVSILARLENVTTAEAAGFADVDDNDWYATAVNWAANVGVVNGYEDNTFRPNTAITREQLAAILMNYAAYKGEDVSARADLSHYSDADSISSWANDVLLWAVAEGLLTGVTDDTIAPQAHATRAQVAAILQRFLSE